MNKGDIFKDSVGRIWKCRSTQRKVWGGKPVGGFLIQLEEPERYNPSLIWDEELEDKGLTKLT